MTTTCRAETNLNTVNPMNTEVATIDPAPMRSANPMDMTPTEFRGGLQRRQENRTALMSWIRESLVDGVDFGRIETKRGLSKPSLRKPGAEKICGMLGVTATFPTLKDYESAALEGRELRQIIIRCHLIAPTGEIVADGVGARSLEQDYGDLNKCLKMAIKSAHIDATLRMAGLSEVFTQDIEDMPRERVGEEASAPQEATRASPASTFRPTSNTRKSATDKQIKLVQFKLEQAGLSAELLCKQFNLDSLPKLPFERVDEALKWIAAEATQTRSKEPGKPLATDFDEGEIPYSEEDERRFSR